VPEKVDKIIQRLEELGEMQVRHLVSNGELPSDWNLTIIKWFSEKSINGAPLVASVPLEPAADAAADIQDANALTATARLELLKMVHPASKKSQTIDVQCEHFERIRILSKIAERAADAATRASLGAERQAQAAQEANTRARIALTVATISVVATAVCAWIVYQFASQLGISIISTALGIGL
jgi:hypothetical protein